MIQTILEWLPVSEHLPEPGRPVLLTDGFRLEKGSLDDRLDRWWLDRRETRNICEWLEPDPKQMGQVLYTHWAYITFPKKETGPSQFYVVKQSGTVRMRVEHEGVPLPKVLIQEYTE